MLPPPPHPKQSAMTSRTKDLTIRRRRPPPNASTQAETNREPKRNFLDAERSEDDTCDVGAVVVMVRITGTAELVGPRFTVDGLKLQELPGGRFEQIEGPKEAEPVKPFCAVNVRVVEPDCPAVAILTTAGFAVMPNDSPILSRSAEEAEALKSESPLY